MMLLLAAKFAAEANPVDMNLAREVGAKFVNGSTTMRTTVNDLRHVITYSTDNQIEAFYVFNVSNGFIIVAADDCSTPILAYSEEGQFDVNNIPVQMEGYLQVYRREIQYGIEHGLSADESIAKQWNMLRTTGSLYGTRTTTAVEPLLSETWNQNCYYNALCPEDADGPCGHVYAGCVATAMGQIMHFWQYPIVGSGSHSYYPDGYPQQTANFGATTYAWNDMPNDLNSSSTSTQINAVATLLWHCGIAVDMTYGAGASGAYSGNVPYALTEYFNYSDELFGQDKSDNASWLALIKANLDLGLPIYYSGSDVNGYGGHAFVCDGYDANDYLHFNWGWSGSGNNAYFALDALNVNGYEFNNYNYAIFNIRPQSGETYQITTIANPDEGGTVTGGGTYYEGQLCTLTAMSDYDYSFVNWTKDGIEVSTNPTISFMVTEDATYTANFELFIGLTVGDGSTNTNVYLPSYSFYCHSLTQQIYTPDDIEWAGSILSLAFYNDGGTKTQNYDIYMVNTDKVSFTGSYDWIPVTEEDLVFSGDVTMISGGWTTIPFDNPFVYEGNSNLAIVVDNNTGSYTGSPHMACRVFGTDEVQAIRVYSDGTNYDPFNPFGYSGTLYTQKNQIRLAFDMVSSEPIVIPDTLAMGYRPNNAWMRPYKIQIYNPGYYSLINSISTDNPYFQLEEIEVPFVLGHHKSHEISLTSGTGIGEMSGHLIINYGDNQEVQFDLSAITYDPAIKDVWETAYEITSYPFTDSLIVADIPLYDNYNLPPVETQGGADAVYKLVFEEDTYLNASLTSGEDGKIALYTEDFMGVGGPDSENNYTSVLNLGNPNNMGNNASFNGQVITNRSGLIDELTVHNGSTTNGYVPLYGFYTDAYLRMEMVYPASELNDMTGSDIQNMKFYASQTNVNWGNASFMVFLTEVADVAINTFYGPAGTVVYEGALSIIDGEMNVIFTTPYHYNGGDLLVGLYSITTGTYVTSTWYGETVNGASFQGYSYSGVNSVNGTQRNFLPKTTFNYTVTSVIANMTVPPGTYYLAASSTSDAWGIEVNTDVVPCPDVVSTPTPADYDTDVIPTAVSLQWSLGERTTEYKLLLGTDYDDLETIVDWTRDLTESYVVTGLLNNTNYFWQIMERNDGCPEGVEGSIWGFTTLLNGPQDLYAWNNTLFEGDDLTLEWTPLADTNILSYNVYQDNEWIGNTMTNNYVVSGLTYNMEGYNFYVTAVYAGGESNASNSAIVYVSGNGAVVGHVYEVDGITGIENATVTFSGNDEFGYYRTFAFTTDADGYYMGSLKAGTYSATVTCYGYQAKHYGGSVNIAYSETTESIDVIMDEVFYPVAEVTAEYYPDATDPNSPYVNVYWSMNGSASGWLYYDDGINQDAIGTGGGQFYWGVMFPAGSYSGNRITKVSMYDYAAHTGTIMIYQGGVTAPNYLLYTQEYSCTGIGDFVEWTMDSPVIIDPSQSLWIVMHNNDGTYIASCCANTGDSNSRWVSLDGTTWEDLAGYGLDYTWMLRACVSNGRGSSTILTSHSPVIHNMTTGSVTLSADPNATPHYVGIPAQVNNNSRSFSHYRVYRTNAYNDGPYTEDNTLLLADNVTDTLLIDVTWPDAEAGVYKFGVSRVYEGNRGEGDESEIAWATPSVNGNLVTERQPQVAEANAKVGYGNSNPSIVNSILNTRGTQAYGMCVYSGSWPTGFITFDVDTPDAVSVINSTYYFGLDYCTADGYYYACEANGYTLYKMDLDGNIISSVNLNSTLTDGAWNASNNTMYAIYSTSLFTVDLATGALTTLATSSNYFRAIACHNGQVYTIMGDGNLYQVNSTGALTLVGSTGYTPSYAQSMAFNNATGNLYWCFSDDSYDHFMQVNPATGAATLLLANTGETCGLCFPIINGLQEPRESEIVWSNSLDKNMYLPDGAVNVTVTLNSGDSPEGVLVRFTNLNAGEQSLYPVEDVTLDATGYYAWDSFRRGDYQVQVSFNDYYTISEEVSIWDATALNYVLEEINYGVSNLYVSRTGWAMWNDSEHGNTLPVIGEVNTFFIDFEDGMLPADWTVIDADGDGYNWRINTELWSNVTGYNGSSGFVTSQSYWDGSALYPDNYLITPQLRLGGILSFWACAQDAGWASEHFGVAISTTDNTSASAFTTIQEWTMTAKGGEGPKGTRGGNRDQGTWYQFSVDLSSYAGQMGYIAFRHFNCSDWFCLNIDDILLENGLRQAKSNRHFEQYQLELSDTEENVIYQGTISDCFMQLPVEDLVDGETYHLKVAAVYSSGISEWQEIDWAYQSCDHFETVTELNMEIGDNANVISWTYPTIETRANGQMGEAFVSNRGGGSYPNGWYSFDLNNIDDYQNSINSNLGLYGGDYCGLDGYVYGTSDDYWYKVDPTTGEIIESGYLGTTFYDCAWDYSTDVMYGVRSDYLYVWNLEEHTYTSIASMGASFESIACDLNGQLYGISINSPAILYKIDKTNGSLEMVGSMGLICDWYWQTCGFDHYTGNLYWFGQGFFAEVNTETGAATVLSYTNSSSHGSFCVPFDGSGHYSPITGVLGAIVYRDGELLGFTTANTYTDTIATGNHEYAIRVVYDGRNRCPNFNAYYAMSCPLTIGGASYEVTVSANPVQGGLTTGAGTYINGFPCTVTATANENYVFTNWIMNGEEIANTPEYTFRVTDNTIMEANFIGFTPHWEVINNPEYSPLSLIGIVNVNGEELTGNYIEVAALCGNECRGRQMLTYYPDQNRFFVFMTIYGQDGDDITFSLYNHELGEETEYSCLSHLTFDAEATVGSYNDPYAILFGIIQTTTMQTGWNWYSTIVEQEGNEGLEMLESSLGSNGVMIKSQTDGFDINYGNLWMGNLDFITNDQMYMINTNAPIEAVVSGFNTNVNNHPITLYTGWTWVGYPHTEALDINDALANLNATNGDILKSKQTFSTYIEGQGWYGTLNTLEPSTGMMYHSKKNSNTTFTYSDARGRMELIPNLTAENNHWIPNDFEYPDNMSVMAVVELNHVELADGDYELAAFENGKCLGSAKLIYVGPINRYMAFLTLSGEEDHVLSFGLYDAETGIAYTSTTETVVFTPNAIVGSMNEPFVVHFDEATGINQYDVTMTIHPNPADRGSLFSIAMSTNKTETVMVEIINALGEVVSVTSSSQSPMMVKAPDIAGIYMVRMIINGKESYSRKLIVK